MEIQRGLFHVRLFQFRKIDSRHEAAYATAGTFACLADLNEIITVPTFARNFR